MKFNIIGKKKTYMFFIFILFCAFFLYLNERQDKKRKLEYEKFDNGNNSNNDNSEYLQFDNKEYIDINKKIDFNEIEVGSSCKIVNFKKLQEINSYATIANNYPYSNDEEFILLRYSFKIEQETSSIVKGSSKRMLYVFRVIDTNNKYSLNYTSISIPKSGKDGTMVFHLKDIGTFVFFTKIYFYGTTSFLYIENFPFQLECTHGFYQFYFSPKPNNYPNSFTGIYKVVSLETFDPIIGYNNLNDKRIIYENCENMIKYEPPHKGQAILPENIDVFKDCVNIVKNDKFKNNDGIKSGNIQWCLSGLENCYTEFKGDKTSSDTCYMSDTNMNISPFCNPYINVCKKPDYVIDEHPYYWRNYGKNNECFGETTYINQRQPVISNEQLSKTNVDWKNRDININGGNESDKNKPKYYFPKKKHNENKTNMVKPEQDIFDAASSPFEYTGKGFPVESDILHCFTCQWRSDDKHYFDVYGSNIKFMGADPPNNNQVYDKECPGSSKIYGPTSIKCDKYLLSPA